MDHTYWNGNVWKQLLGALNDWNDDDRTDPRRPDDDYAPSYSPLEFRLPGDRRPYESTSQSIASRSNEQADNAMLQLPERIVRDISDTSSVKSSFQPSISSFDSTRSSLSSKSSLESSPTLWATVTELKTMFAIDERFSFLCKTAIGSQGIGVLRLQRNLHRLVKNFASELMKEAAVEDKVGRAAAGAIRSIARRLAMEITRVFTSDETVKEAVDEAMLSEPTRHRELESSLAAYHPNSVRATEGASADDIELADGISSDDDIDNAEDQDQKDVPSVLQARTFILSSNAFSNMRWSLHRFLYPDVLQNISKEMKVELDSHGQHTVIFDVPWNLLKFYEDELEGNSDLATVLTLTGTSKVALAMTCQEYVVRHWPSIGQDLLTFLETAIRQRTHRESQLILSKMRAF